MQSYEHGASPSGYPLKPILQQKGPNGEGQCDHPGWNNYPFAGQPGLMSDLRPAIEAYANTISPATLSQLGTYLNALLAFLHQGSHTAIGVENINQELIAEHATWLKKTGVSKGYRAQHHSTGNRLLKHLHARSGQENANLTAIIHEDPVLVPDGLLAAFLVSNIAHRAWVNQALKVRIGHQLRYRSAQINLASAIQIGLNRCPPNRQVDNRKTSRIFCIGNIFIGLPSRLKSQTVAN
jgi:hypothetical protein